jgi:hypothetical protein
LDTGEATEIIRAYGHESIKATHKTTFEVTKDNQMSKRGDCIVAVSANKALTDLSTEFKESLRKNYAKLTISIEVSEVVEVIHASGSAQLILAHPTEMVIRKSDYVCNRTLAIRADKAAGDLSKRLREKLRNPKQKVKIALTVRV